MSQTLDSQNFVAARPPLPSATTSDSRRPVDGDNAPRRVAVVSIVDRGPTPVDHTQRPALRGARLDVRQRVARVRLRQRSRRIVSVEGEAACGGE